MAEHVDRLDVIGNISRDLTRYPDQRGGARLGGAALFVSLAATKAGRRAAPVCVLGNDLAHLPQAPGLDALDWTARLQTSGTSTTFDLEYDLQGELVEVRTDYWRGRGSDRAHAGPHQHTPARDLSRLLPPPAGRRGSAPPNCP